MIAWLHNKATNCQTCNEAFFYDESLVRRTPRVCVRCKLDGLARRDKTKQLRIKQQAAAMPGTELATLVVKTHDQVATILGISPEAVRKAERSALAKIRCLLERRNKQIFPAATASTTLLLTIPLIS